MRVVPTTLTHSPQAVSLLPLRTCDQNLGRRKKPFPQYVPSKSKSEKTALCLLCLPCSRHVHSPQVNCTPTRKESRDTRTTLFASRGDRRKAREVNQWAAKGRNNKAAHCDCWSVWRPHNLLEVREAPSSAVRMHTEVLPHTDDEPIMHGLLPSFLSMRCRETTELSIVPQN